MARESTEGILKHLRQIFSLRSDEESWEALTRQIERSFAQQRFDELEKSLEQASAFLRKERHHPEHAARLHQLAEYFEAYSGNFKRSEELYREAIDLLERQTPNDPLKAAPSLNSLAVLLIHQRRYSEAEAVIRRLLPIVEARFGKEHPEYATCLENLAATMRNSDRDAEAAKIRKDALLIRQEYRRKQPS